MLPIYMANLVLVLSLYLLNYRMTENFFSQTMIEVLMSQASSIIRFQFIFCRCTYKFFILFLHKTYSDNIHTYFSTDTKRKSNINFVNLFKSFRLKGDKCRVHYDLRVRIILINSIYRS